MPGTSSSPSSSPGRNRVISSPSEAPISSSLGARVVLKNSAAREPELWSRQLACIPSPLCQGATKQAAPTSPSTAAAAKAAGRHCARARPRRAQAPERPVARADLAGPAAIVPPPHTPPARLPRGGGRLRGPRARGNPSRSPLSRGRVKEATSSWLLVVGRGSGGRERREWAGGGGRAGPAASLEW